MFCALSIDRRNNSRCNRRQGKINGEIQGSVKPVKLEGLVSVMKALVQYWFEIVELTPERVKA